jgi:hypothetical protein
MGQLDLPRRSLSLAIRAYSNFDLVMQRSDYYTWWSSRLIIIYKALAEPSAGELGLNLYFGQLKCAPALNAVSAREKPGHSFVLDATSTLCVSFF